MDVLIKLNRRLRSQLRRLDIGETVFVNHHNLALPDGPLASATELQDLKGRLVVLLKATGK